MYAPNIRSSYAATVSIICIKHDFIDLVVLQNVM